MGFNTIHFLFVFLPITLILFYLVPGKARQVILVLASLVFYAWGGLRSLAYLILSMAFNYITGLELDILKKRGDENSARLVIISSTVANVLALAMFKYTAIGLPLGVSFYTFTVLSYIFDVYYGKAVAQKNPLKYMLYVSFFPKLVSGPIVKYWEMEDEIENPQLRENDVLEGGQLFMVGLLKKVLIADALGAGFASLQASGASSVVDSWLLMILYSLQLYYDFSGYSDMAIGLSKIFGFNFSKNFDHPYLSKSISEFWRRWHISLGSWFKEYVYFPLGGSKVEPKRLFINLLAVWVLTGIWHGSTLNFLAWGLFHGFFVILEKFVIKDKLDILPGFVKIILTDLVVFIGWIFFFSPGLVSALGNIGRLVGIGVEGFTSDATLFCIRENLILIIIVIIGAGEIVQKLYQKIFYDNVFNIGKNGLRACAIVLSVVLLTVAVAGIVSNTYSSFLYFKF